MSKFNVAQFNNDIAQFTGTEQWYRHTTGLLYTDGVKFMATECGAYWMIDYALSYQLEKWARAQSFQVWQFTRSGESMKVEVTDGNNNLVQLLDIEFTDFPLNEFTLWFVDGVLLLPSEY